MLNWMRRVTADGVIFYPPEGRTNAGALRVRELVRPLQTLRDIRAEQVRRLSHLGTIELSPAAHEVTVEGEHAALYQLAITGAGKLELHVGVVFGDDGYQLVEGMCGDPELASTFAAVCKRLTLGLPLGLGSDRRRRFRYQHPEGWQAVAKRHSVVWYPPDYPQNRASIHVFDTKRKDLERPGQLERMVLQEPQHSLQSFTDHAVFALLTDTGLHGAYDVLRGTWMGGVPAALIRATAVDARYSYSLRLEACDPGIDAARALFDLVVRSIEPVPTPVLPQEHAVIHWVE